MLREMLVESRSYDQVLRGTWQAYKLDDHTRLGDEQQPELTGDFIRVWLPAGTPMRWANGTRPMRSNCVQFFWPQRWYMLSAFYDKETLRHTYASIIQPVTIKDGHLSYVDLDLNILVKPDLSYEVLTQVEFEQAADTLHYSEETRISALMALRTLTSAVQLSVGLFANVPYRLQQTDFHLASCNDRLS